MDEAAEFEAVHARFRAFGQDHVLRYWPDLAPAERRELVRQAGTIDLAALEQLWQGSDATGIDPAEIEPAGDAVCELGGDGSDRSRWAELGAEAVIAGRVAVVIAAGGQGTRLGFGAPKGLFPIGPQSEQCLLAWLVDKVRHHADRHDVTIPVVLMVSDATESALREAANLADDFGLPEGALLFVRQGSLPAVDDDGRLMLAGRGSVALSPNGHGGLYRALVDSGVATLLRERGIDTLSYVQVDNPLIQPVDPVFLGLHLEAGSELSSKSVRKTRPEERVGVFARAGGALRVVEYSELPGPLAEQRDADGELVHRQGSIAAHVLDLDFVERVADAGLPVHRARKKVPYVDERGRRIRPSEANATKFETFLFDALPLARSPVVLEVERARQFAPVKNAEGADSPATASAALQSEFRRWYEAAGREPPEGVIELSPLEYPDEDAFVRG